MFEAGEQTMFGYMSEMDAAVGKIMTAFKASGRYLLRPTLVVMTYAAIIYAVMIVLMICAAVSTSMGLCSRLLTH